MKHIKSFNDTNKALQELEITLNKLNKNLGIIAAVQTSKVVFKDNDTSLMTSAAIADKIESYNYLTSTLSDEQVQDKVGAMFSGNTETLITATYQDADGTIDLVVDNNLSNYDNSSSGFTTTAGTVTSVGGTGAVNGLTLTGTVTTSGNLTLGGTLAINNGDWSGTALADANIASASTWNSLVSNATHTGDVTGATSLTIADDAVTYAKIQNVTATNRILGRDSAGAGVIEEITPANLRTMINVADGAEANVSGNSGNAAIYDNSGDAALKTGITGAEVRAAIGAGTSNLALGTSGSTALAGNTAVGDANVQSDWNASSGDAQILNKPTIPVDLTSDGAGTVHANNYTNTTYSVGDGGLTQNNFTNTLKSKLDGIATGAEVNVKSDWDESDASDDSHILNKPTVYYTSAIPNATASQTGLATSTQITKLDGIEASATADQTKADINALDITEVGTITSGVWTGSAIADSYISSASTWNAKQNTLTFGIANDNAVEMDASDVVEDDYAQFTAGGLKGTSASELLTDIGAAALAGSSGQNFATGTLTANNHILAKTVVYFDAETANTIGNGATGAIDWTHNQKQKVTITGTGITCNFTNPPGPCNLTLKVVQGDGSDVIGTWDSDIKWAGGGTPPTLSTGNGEIDILSFYFDGTNYFGVASLDFQ